MHIRGESLDDILFDLYGRILASPLENEGKRGDTKELIGVSLTIEKPRARLSRSENRGKPFSALGELLWYLAGSDNLDFIKAYVSRYSKETEDRVTIHGAYGPRIFAMRGEVNQLDNVTKLLKRRPGSRRAVIQLFNAEDLARDFKEIPCTTTLQFLLRQGRLHMSVTLRSNDAYWGLPHDAFCFTMLQEMMAQRLNAELGEYHQYVGSMHIYRDYLEQAQSYRNEGLQKSVEMPAMPEGDPFQLVPRLLEAERQIRAGRPFDATAAFDEPYWADIVRLLQADHLRGDTERLDRLEEEFADPMYRSYLESRRAMNPRRPDEPVQPTMSF